MGERMTRQHLRVFLNGYFCWCGNPDDASAFLLALLRAHPVYDHGDEWDRLLPDNGARYFIAYMLDHMGLTEHGGSVMGGWLTPLGVAVRDALAAEEADSFEVLTENHCVHGYSIDGLEAELNEHDCMASKEPDTAEQIAKGFGVESDT